MASSIERCRAVLAALLLSTAAFCAWAQHAVFEPYQESAGLTNMAALCLTQARDGTLWICTENGLFRFDGFRVHRETLPVAAGISVQGALADRYGRLWITTETGLFLRRATEGAPNWFPVASREGAALRVEGGQRLDVDDNGILYAMDDHSRLWAVTAPPSTSQPPLVRRAAVPQFEPWGHATETDGGPVRAAGGALWFGCGAGLCESRDGRLTTWGASQGLPAAAWSNLLRGRDGSLWARSSDRLARLAPQSTRFEVVGAPAARIWAGNIALAEDASGAILTATDNGLAQWDGRRWHQWTTRDGLPETVVRALLFDAEGSLWLGTSGRGVHRWIGYGEVAHWTEALGMPSPVVDSFARDGRGRLWAATSRGIAWFDESARRFRPLNEQSRHPGLVSRLAVDAAGDLWWVTDGHLLTLRHGDSTARECFSDASFSYVVPATGTVYVVSYGGVERLVRSSTGIRREPILNGLPRAGELDDVITDGTREWLLVDSRAYRVDHGAWVPMLDDRGAPVDVFSHATFAGSSEFWAADSKGVSVYSMRGAVAHLSRRFNRSSFGGASTLFLRADATGRIWMGTDKGLFILEDGRWIHMDRTNGLLWDDIDSYAFLLDPDGTAWIGSSAGATQIHPGRPQLAASALRLDELQVGTTTMHAPPAAPVSWADRRLRITVGSPSIGRGRDIRIEYRLHDSEPWQAIEGNEVVLESLESASYLLELRAAARLPIDTPGPVLRIAFTVAPPWWRSTLALLSYAGALAVLWWLSTLALRRRARASRRALKQAIAERTSQLEESRKALRKLGDYNARSLEDERKRVARELHDEMGQQLAALRMEVSVLRLRTRADQPPNQEQLGMLLERVDRMVASVRSLVTQLRPPALDGGLLAAIEWLVSEFTLGTGVPCDLELDEAARDLPPDTATMVFRIAQESLNNVRRHAQASHILVHLQRNGNVWELTVGDDGVGFDTAGHRTGHGLLGMQERTRMLGGALTIDSAPGRGTTIRLRSDAVLAAPT